MRIAISGKSGCGNTTVTKLVAEKLSYPMINFTFRNLAKEKGYEFWEFCKLAETNDSYDRELDSRQVAMAMNEENCVLGSRLAIWMLKEADFKVYLDVSEQVRAQRVLNREGGSLSQRLEQTAMRDKNDSARYKKIYGIDNNDTSAADLVVDANDLSPDEISDLIIKTAFQTVSK
jgi:cytidylate kinase